MVKLVRGADLVFHNNISLRSAWPLVLFRRPWFVTTQTWLSGQQHQETPSSHRKRRLLQRANNLYISQSIGENVGWPGEVIGNPYDEHIFNLRADQPAPGKSRPRDLIFVGRMVSDKGADVLIDALRLLPSEQNPNLTLIGDGPERNRLENYCQQNGLSKRVTFRGACSSSEIATQLRQHRCLVVPSRWAEPFGIVALEGLACGCTVVGSSGGGLTEAMGPTGRVFRNGDAQDLADRIADVWKSDLDNSVESVAHLERHTSASIAARYLNHFKQLRA
ncbi:MAG: hypothetical protein SynsKO_12940 [Synoicihabitans sp.]